VLRKLSNVVFDPMIQKFNLSILQSALYELDYTLFVDVIFHIETLFDFMLYIEFVFFLLMHLLTTM
jgi:hypothetical protein